MSKLDNFKKWGVLITLSLALAIIIIDGTVLNVSISNIIKDLNTDLKSIQWAITLYSLIVASLTITGGRLGDLFGRKKMFILGAVIFACGSFLTSISTNIGILILGWSVIEGIGAALMMPATASLLVASFQGRERSIAFGVWGGIAGAASAFGPILGGFLTTNYSWNWAFRINIVIVLLLIMGSFLIKENRDKTHKPQLDILGVILSTLGVGSIVYGVIESSTYGWIKSKIPYEFFGSNFDLIGLSVTIYAIIFGIIVLILFFVWENFREKTGYMPLLSLKLFFNRAFSSGIFTTSALALGQSGLIFAIPVFFQTVRHKNAFDTGIALLPLSLSLLLAAPLSGYISHKLKPKFIIQFGIIFNLIGAALLFFSINVNSDVINFIPGQIFFGAGFGLISAQISNITLSAVDIKQIGEASGVNSMIRQLGSSLGSAIIGAIFIGAFTTNFISNINSSPNIPLSEKNVIYNSANKESSKYEYYDASYDTQNNLAIKNDLSNARDISVTNGAKQSLLYECIFILICFAVSFTIPNKNLSNHKNINSKYDSTDNISHKHDKLPDFKMYQKQKRKSKLI